MKITSPGSSGRIADSSAMMRETLKIMSEVRLSCTSSSFTQQRSAEIVTVRHLVGRHETGPERTEGRKRLAERELPAARPLHDALGDVLSDGEPGDVVPGRALADPIGADAHHDDQLDFPVDGRARQEDVGVRARRDRSGTS